MIKGASSASLKIGVDLLLCKREGRLVVDRKIDRPRYEANLMNPTVNSCSHGDVRVGYHRDVRAQNNGSETTRTAC